MKKKPTIGWKPVFLLVSIGCIFAAGIIGFAKANPGEGLRKLNPQAVVKEWKVGFVKEAGEKPEIVQIRGDVLSVAVINHGGDGITESFIKVQNKAQIGDEYIVCLMPNNLTEVFSLAFSKGMTVRAWGFKFNKPDEYQGLPISGYIVLAARVVHDDVPSNLANIGLPYELELGGKRAELK